jgi:hypothetical protein
MRRNRRHLRGVPEPERLPRDRASLLAEIDARLRERERLRERGGSARDLERRRSEITRLQWQLARAMHARGDDPEAA